MTLPTMVTFLWRGWRPVYDHRHVNALNRMLQATSPGLRLVCVTDMPQGIECETKPLWPEPVAMRTGERNSFVRLRLFDPAIGRTFGDRVCNIDLDCVILDDLRPLFADTGDFRAVRGVRAPINGSMWCLKPGAHANVWSGFHPVNSLREISMAIHRGKRITGSDQAWLSLRIPNPATWGPEHGVQQYSHYQRDLKTRILFFAGAIKPWDAAGCGKCAIASDTYRMFFDK